MWQLDGPQDGQRPHEGRDFRVLFINTPQHRNTLGDGGEKPAETLWLSEVLRAGAGEDPTKKDRPQPGQSLLPSPNDDPPLAPETAASTGDRPEDEAGVGMGHRQAWVVGSPRPASLLWAPSPNSGC